MSDAERIAELQAEVAAMVIEVHAHIEMWGKALREREAATGKAAGLLEAHTQIVEWADAYPLERFPEPDLKRAAAVLAAAGLSLDAISASNMRHAINGAARIARAAIAAHKGGEA